MIKYSSHFLTTIIKITLYTSQSVVVNLVNLLCVVTSLERMLISASTQSGQSKSPQKRNLWKKTLYNHEIDHLINQPTMSTYEQINIYK